MEGISHKPPPPSLEFPYFEHKNNPPHPSGISASIMCTPIPLEKTVLVRKAVKINTPNT